VSLPPTLGHGKICYIEIRRSISDGRRSAEFYEKIFCWQTHQRGDGALTFAQPICGAISKRLNPNRSPAASIH
jgi:predicted enzyme related to lactoylglutathione lyase